MNKIFRKSISILLTIALSISLTPAAFAAESNQNITYVALGDSMSQGYGFLDYNTDNIACGFGSSSPRSSVCLFYNHLKKQDSNIQFHDLTVQGFLPDELWALLSGNNSKLTASASDHFEGWIKGADNNGIFDSFEAMSEYYKNELSNAKVITYDIGINYFGTYLGDRMDGEVNDDVEHLAALMDCLSFEQKQQAADLRMKLKTLLGKNDLLDKASTLIDSIIYGYASYIYYTDKCIDWIYKNNPNEDMKLIVVGLYNPHPDITLTISKGKIKASKIIDALIESLNFYVSKLNKYSGRYAFVDMSKNPAMSFADEFYYASKPEEVSLDAKSLIGQMFLTYDKSTIKKAYEGEETIESSEIIRRVEKLTEICIEAVHIRECSLNDLLNANLNGSSITNAVDNATSLSKSELVALHIDIRTDSLGAHPSPAGNTTKSENIISVYEKKTLPKNNLRINGKICDVRLISEALAYSYILNNLSTGREENIAEPLNGAVYKVTLVPSEHGTVKLDNENPSAGDKVTITVVPETGYEVGKIYINGKEESSLAIENVQKDYEVEVIFNRIEERGNLEESTVFDKQLKDEAVKAGVEATTVAAKSELATTKSGKKGIKLTWEKSKGYKVDYYEVYRSTKKSSGYKNVYTTKTGNATSYTNTKDLKSGTKYYYKVRGVRVVDGEKVYTEWSTKAVRTFK